jgi:hypothetical protein
VVILINYEGVRSEADALRAYLTCFFLALPFCMCPVILLFIVFQAVSFLPPDFFGTPGIGDMYPVPPYWLR